MPTAEPPHFVTLGMFIIDEFLFEDEDGNATGKVLDPHIGGGGTYAAIGARIWLPPQQIGMVVNRGGDFPPHIQEKLETYGSGMWIFRDHGSTTTKALNSYRGEHRNFKYLTPRIGITPKDLNGTKATRPRTLHFICLPTRATAIISEVPRVEDWKPLMIYEPIPDRCVPEELSALREVLPYLHVLSPNAEEALSLLSYSLPPTKESIEHAAAEFLAFGVGERGEGCVIIRSGALGAYVTTRTQGGRWIEAFWGNQDTEKVVDVTGAGNSFLGGLSPGLRYTSDIFQGIGSFAESTKDDEINEDFERLKETRNLLQSVLASDYKLLLSMGMSSDFEAAICSGSDIVRVGTGIFGARPKQKA